MAPPQPQVRVASPAKKGYQTIFPQYLDSNYLPSQGRKISKASAVPGPTLDEIYMALSKLGYSGHYADPLKSLPCLQSSAFIFPAPRGCIKVLLKEPLATSTEGAAKRAASPADRKPTNPEHKTKGDVLRKVAEIIKALPDRKPYPGPAHQLRGEKKRAEAEERKQKKSSRGGKKGSGR